MKYALVYMQKVKKAVRLMGLILLIVLASCGIGMTGVFLPTNRERYMDVEIKTEQVDKEDENELEVDEIKT